MKITTKDMMMRIVFFAVLGAFFYASLVQADNKKPRARDIGLHVGTILPGKYNAITDVAGVRVGHHTVNIGDDIRTGITAIIPSDHDMYLYPIPAWIHSGNGYGKLIGETQVREFGEKGNKPS